MIVFEGLDRAVTNQQSLNLYEEARVENYELWAMIQIMAQFFLRWIHGTRKLTILLFHFEAKWLLQNSFMQLVHQTWRNFIKASCAYQLARKIEFLRKYKSLVKTMV